MSAKSELLETSPEEFVRKLFPKGDFLCQITEAELLEGYWKDNPDSNRPARWFLSYVPTIEVIDYVPTGDEDIDEETLAALETFGDWKGYRPPNGSGNWTQRQTIPGYNDRVRCAGIANGLNFPITDTTPDWENRKGDVLPSGARFFTSANSQGRVDGWVVKVLSTDPQVFTPPEIGSDSKLPAVIEATKQCYLVVTLDHEQDEKGEYEPKVVCTGSSSV